MNLDAVYSQFGKVSPLPVLARVALEHATSNDFLEGLFAEHADRQVANGLLFSTSAWGTPRYPVDFQEHRQEHFEGQ